MAPPNFAYNLATPLPLPKPPPKMKTLRYFFALWLALAWAALPATAQKMRASVAKTQVEAYDFQEITLTLSKPFAQTNPFKEVAVTGVFQLNGGPAQTVHGFCDAQDGRVFRVRYLPTRAGRYTYSVQLVAKNRPPQTTKGSFVVVASQRRGVLQIDPAHPWHFVYANSGEHYFWNGTTAYWLLGWRDERVMEQALDRLANLGVNRLRVAINGRAHGGSRWAEPNVVESPGFTFKLNPWLAERPDDLDNPGFDVTRFNVPHWQRLDRVVARARERGIIVSIIFYVDGLDHGCDPFKKANMGNADEQMYYRYAAARYAGYENIMWDIANEYHLFRTVEWGEKMGAYLKSLDPLHLISVHGSSDFPFRKSPWVDVVMYQSWDECGGYEYMLACKEAQAASGRILPQVNEEYGYEDHYPTWGCGATASKVANGRNGRNRSQLAWEIYLAGGYQTTGERADFGTGAGPDTGGGWINGRGNDQMTMLKYYQVIRQVFEGLEYWKMQPQRQLVNYGNLCLAEVGQQYLVYSRLPRCRVVLPPGLVFGVEMINPQTGARQPLPDCRSDENGAWQYPKELTGDWVFVLRRK
jgi:hypothetical protein